MVNQTILRGWKYYGGKNLLNVSFRIVDMVVIDTNGARSPNVNIHVAFVGTNSHSPLLTISRKFATSVGYFVTCSAMNRTSDVFYGKYC